MDNLLVHRKKFEIATDEEGTPIKQDTKKGKLREVSVPCLPGPCASLGNFDVRSFNSILILALL